MVAETPMNSSSGAAAPIAVARSTGEALVDAFTLAELQVQLAEVDLRDAWRQLTRGCILISAGAVLGISTIPPTLIGLAYALANATRLELWACLLITGGVAFLFAALLFAWGWREIKRRGALFARSRAELRQNAKWLKSMLRQSSAGFRRSNGSPASAGDSSII